MAALFAKINEGDWMKNPDAFKQQKRDLNRMNQAVKTATLRVCEDFCRVQRDFAKAVLASSWPC